MPIERALLWALGAVLALSGCGWIQGFSAFSGKVVDPSGKPLSGVAIASDRAATLSAEDGTFTLSDASGAVTARKVRYQARQVDRGAGGTVVLTPSDEPVTVVWDERWQSPAMDGVIAHLQGQGFSIQRVRQGDVPEGRQVYVLPTPAWFTQEAYRGYLRLAGQGAKLVVLGEWGGYDGVDFAACNALASQAGISFVPAAVRVYGAGEGTPNEWLTIHRFDSASLATGLKQGIRLFTAGALDVKEPARALLRTGTDGVRIQAWSTGAQVLAAAGPLGRGSLVAFSDTSLFTDEAGSDGIAHHQVLDNQAFAVNLLAY
ncbi:MAG TPA: carboxypeptidase-like regulatory domain-containing protein [Pantanalinema sp.]